MHYQEREIDVYNLHKCWKISCLGFKVFVFVEVYKLVLKVEW